MAFFYAVLWGLTINCCSAQSNVYPIREYTREDGLLFNFRKIEQDTDGYIWILYNDGIQRFDGKHMRMWYSDERIYSMVTDKDGTVWISKKDGIFKFDININDFYQIKEGGGDPEVLFQIPSSSPCFISKTGIAHYNEVKNEFETSSNPGHQLATRPSISSSLVSNFNHVLFYAKGDTIWRHDLKTSELSRTYYPELRNFFAISENEIVLSNWENRAWYFNFKKGIERRIILDKDDPAMVIFGAIPSKGNEVFLASLNGLLSYNVTNDKLRHIDLSFDGQAYPIQRYRAVFKGKDNRTWACTENSLIYFNYSDSNINFITSNKTGQEDYFNSDVRNFAADGSGNIWLATANGLSKWNIKNNRFTTILPKENSKNFLNHSSIRGLVYDGNNLIIGQTNKGIWIYNPHTKTFKRPNYPKDSIGEVLKQKSEADFINQIVTLRNGNHLVSAHHGLYLLEKNNYRISELEKQNPDAPLIFAFEDSEGKIYIGSTAELSLYSDSLKFIKSLKIDDKIRGYSTMLETDSSFIIGTFKGVFELSKKDLKFRPFIDALSSMRISTLFNDKNNNLWIVTESELFKYNPRSQILSPYRYPENVRGNFFYSNAYHRDKNGLVYIGGTNGINTFYPENILTTSSDLNTRISSFIIPEFSEENQIGTNGLELKYFHNNIDVFFETPYFGNPDDLVYYYRLNEQVKWHEHGNSNKLLLWNLSPGRYDLQIATALSGGALNTADQVLHFEINYPFWQQNWFILSGLFIIAAIVFRIIRTYRLKLFRARLLNSFATSLYGQGSVHNILWATAQNCVRKLGFVDCVVYLVDKKRNVLVQNSAYGIKNPDGNEIINLLEIPIGEGIVGSVAKSGKGEIVHNTRKDSRYILDTTPALSEIAIPIFVEGEVFGVIDSEHPRKRFYNRNHFILLNKIAAICGERITKYLSEENLRSRIARDLHDEMGSNLTSIHILSKLASEEKITSEPVSDQFMKINSYVSGIMENLGDLVWTVNPDNDNFDKLMYRIKEYAAETLENAGIALQFVEISDAWKIRLNAEERKNIYLIAKEGLNNAVKYSKASMIQIKFSRVENETLTMTLRDDGIGFDINNSKQGNGLSNMRHRAEEIGGKLVVKSELNVGVLIQLNFPTTTQE